VCVEEKMENLLHFHPRLVLINQIVFLDSSSERERKFGRKKA
jgi:hypothetical protein